MSRTAFQFQFGEPKPEPASTRSRAAKFRILVLGDLTGRASRNLRDPQSLSLRRVLSIDVDNFGAVLAQLSPEVHVPISTTGDGVSIGIQSLDDFHPDALFDRLPLFESLRTSRRRLLDPARFAEEAVRWRRPSEMPPASGPPPSTTQAPPARPADPVSNAALLDQVLGHKERSDEAASQPAVRIAGIDLGRLIDEVAAPYAVPKADPQQAELVAAVDQAAAGVLRRLLHAPAFQRLEAMWLQLWRLTKALTGEGEVRLYLFDITREELAADLQAMGTDVVRTGLHRAIVDNYVTTAGGEPWSLLVVQESFGRSEGDCQLLATLGALARAAGGPLLADAAPDIVGLSSWSDAADDASWRLEDKNAEQRWETIRASPTAGFLGLCAPRPQIRLPYGKLNPVRRLAFQELGPKRNHESLLWGSAALACTEIIGRAFLRSGWQLKLGDSNDLDDLPADVYESEGEKSLQAAAETFLTIRSGEALAARGVMPLLSYANRHAARCSWFGTLSQPPKRLFP